MSEGIIDGIRRQIGLWNAQSDLKRIESAQPEGNGSYTHADPASVGPMPEGLSNVADPTQNQGQQFLGKTYVQLNPDQVEKERTAARVATMRQNGLYGMASDQQQDADRSFLNGAQVERFKTQDRADQLGLQDAQRTRQLADQAFAIDKQAGASLSGLSDAQGNPRQPTSDEVIQSHAQRALKFLQAGRTDLAAKAQEEYTGALSQRVAGQQAQRTQSGLTALAALQSGDFGPAMRFYKDYIPDGQEITAVQPGKKPGTLAVTINHAGKPVTSEVSKTELMEQAQQTIMMAASKDPAAALKFISEQALNGAKMANQLAAAGAHRASATASMASAGASSARAEGERTDTLIKRDSYTQKQAFAKAMGVPEDRRTPAQQTLIREVQALSPAERETFTSHVLRANGDTTGIAVVGNRSGSVTVKPVNGDGSAPAAARPSPAKPVGASIPADPSKRTVGQVYTAPSGAKAKWTGSGWQPM